jgi:aspartyl-tRNA(Asn)/glutamyl-tRNA(Gln) amidotransferase subunit C
MKIARKDVQYVAALANLELSEAEQERMERDLNSILGYVDQLAELDTTNVEPMTQVSEMIRTGGDVLDPLRADELCESLPREAALANAPQADGTFFRVPKVIER